jgi:hypothetical protein
MRLKRFDDGSFGFDMPEQSAEETAARKAHSTRCGHVKRRLANDERLTGKTLEFALGILGDDEFSRGIAEKLKAGKKLGEYEFHMLVEVWLLHVRLAGP